MPLVKPFKAVIYNRKKIGNLAKVVAPPYDIIPKWMQNDLYRAYPQNIVRIILNKITDKDTARDNRYTRSQKFFHAWQKSKVLIQDEKPALYVYSQIYKDGKKAIERIGFIGRLQLDLGSSKKVLAHENTLAAPKVDRLQLIRKVKSNLSPIFVLYDDNSHAVTKVLKKAMSSAKPFINTNFQGVVNRVWRLDDPGAIKKVEKILAPKNTFIADGHHRYEVARTYAAEVLADRRASAQLKSNAKSIMAYFVELDEKMLTILPAHRSVKDIGSLTPGEVIVKLAQFFQIRKARGLGHMMSELAKLSRTCAFGLYTGKNDYYIMKLKDPAVIDRTIKVNSRDWRRLDVSILHLFVMQHVLGISDADENVEFEKEPRDAAKLVDSRACSLAFFLNPTKASQVKRIAQHGERMPRKATYFYPKPVSGLVINKLD